MNKRIQELAKQAGFDVIGDKLVPVYLSPSPCYGVQRLIELVVNDCVTMAKGFEFAVGRDGLSETMKEHFGVK